MEKIIEIDILNKDDLLEKFDKKKISKELMEYIIVSSMYLKKTDTIKLIINNGV